MTSLHIPVTTLQLLAQDLLSSLGGPSDTAEKVAAFLINADMHGYNTHGVGLVPMYARMIGDGAIDPLATATITHETDCIISVDGHDGFGQLGGELATTAAIKATQKSGLAVVAIRNASHLGRLGEWAEKVADAGLVFMAFTNTGGGAINVAAFGGHERKFSTNPIAFAIPTFSALPFDIIVDFATSQVSGAVIHQHHRTSTALHDDWTTTASGQPVADASAFMAGEGALLPLGGRTTGHKGYGLSLVAELLGGIAGGMVVGQHEPDWFSNAAIFHLLDPLRFLSIEEIEKRVTVITTHLEGENTRLPGQRSYEHFLLAQKQGISIQPHVLGALLKLAGKLGVAVATEITTLMPEEDNSSNR
jgi:LDH2 family malate/lactate/ureidoglycolate dehydrogenase